MRILIGPIRLASGVDSLLSGDENPGIGGTDYSALQVAIRIATETEIDVNVFTLGSASGLSFGGRPLKVLSLETVIGSEPFDICLVPATRIQTILKLLDTRAVRTVLVWSHHPYDHYAAQAVKLTKVEGLVSVGGYQYWSNHTDGPRHHWIPNPFPTWVQDIEGVSWDSRSNVIGSIGALVPGKGFHHVARYWQHCQRVSPNFRLEVVGSGDLYGTATDGHSCLPTSANYGRQLIRELGGSVPPSVSFLGRVATGKAHIISNWKYAVQNLTGKTEAFPGTLLELVAGEVIVIASNRHGMWDLMANFPEVTVDEPAEYPQRIQTVEKSKELRLELSNRGRAIADKWRAYDRDDLVASWNHVFEQTIKGGRYRTTQVLDLKPKSPPLGSMSFAWKTKVRLRGTIMRNLKAIRHRILAARSNF